MNKGNYVQLSLMAVPGFVLSNTQEGKYFYLRYEYIIDGKVYKFEIYK